MVMYHQYFYIFGFYTCPTIWKSFFSWSFPCFIWWSSITNYVNFDRNGMQYLLPNFRRVSGWSSISRRSFISWSSSSDFKFFYDDSENDIYLAWCDYGFLFNRCLDMFPTGGKTFKREKGKISKSLKSNIECIILKIMF